VWEKFIEGVGWVSGFKFQVVGLTALSKSLLRRRFLFCGMTRFAGFLFFGMTIARVARYLYSLCEPVERLSGMQNVLDSPDGSGNPFSFLLPSRTSSNKKEKDCSGQRDQ